MSVYLEKALQHNEKLRHKLAESEKTVGNLEAQVRELESFYDPNNMGLTHLKMKRYFEEKEAGE